MTLDVLICTINGKISQVANVLLPPKVGVNYIVSWQKTDGVDYELPIELKRDDVKVYILEEKGLSKNRNNALKYATGDVCLIADDDVKYYANSFDNILNVFARNSHLDLATFKYHSETEKKTYPKEEVGLYPMPKRYYVSSIEIAFRRTSVQNKLWFNEFFGLGAPILKMGEESVFLWQAIKQGMNCRFFPITIVEHLHETSAVYSKSTKGAIMANAAYLYYTYKDFTTPLRAVLMAWRMKNSILGYFRAQYYVILGMRYAKNLIKNKKLM